ncbi:hypothetical protein PIB30_041072 [Stylosanthes scabra]|uniref:RRM domain-containing protein n=1 Tax=Stylosanthes scabra TaxID=79078 RepID=A0ABU6WEY2_9FABA|nr:hypothetical protein [Stylosanthes scabra]
MRAGASWREVLVRGKHCEDSGFAGRRHKGGMWDGEHLVLGGKCDLGMRGFHTVFVDNLPFGIRKGELYQLFWADGFVKDVYVSNKHRSKVTCPFAFVRFEDAGDARRAIDRLNGGLWKGRKIVVSMLKYRHRYGRDVKGHADESARRKGVENDGYNNNGNTRIIQEQERHGWRCRGPSLLWYCLPIEMRGKQSIRRGRLLPKVVKPRKRG